MIRAVRWLALVLPWASTMACAPIPPPAALGEVDGIRVSPASQEAKRYAPSAFAYAEQLRRRAHQALETDDHASAQLLAERANAARGEAGG
jgi:hypothetical protein